MTNMYYIDSPIESFTSDFYNTSHPKIDGLNSLGFRSDEFTKIHNKKHVLFAGCSNTFGLGLEKEELWSWQTYKKIKNSNDCSGFFNIGSIGIGITQIVVNIFKYCKEYGNPNVIFINLSNQNRMFYYSKNKKEYILKIYDDNNLKDIELLNYQYYFMLEQYCLSNNIKLYSFSWDTNENDHINNKEVSKTTNTLFKEYKFKTFYYYDFNLMLNDLYNLESSKKFSSDYFLIARDGRHHGVGFNYLWSNFIYNKYVEDKYDKKN